MKPLYIRNKNKNWHCQRQKTSRILLASDFATRTARYVLDSVLCFSYIDYKLTVADAYHILKFHI